MEPKAFDGGSDDDKELAERGTFLYSDADAERFGDLVDTKIEKPVLSV